MPPAHLVEERLLVVSVVEELPFRSDRHVRHRSPTAAEKLVRAFAGMIKIALDYAIFDRIQSILWTDKIGKPPFGSFSGQEEGRNGTKNWEGRGIGRKQRQRGQRRYWASR